MTRTHWMAPDVAGDILAEAMRPDAAEPVAVHVRSDIHALMCRQTDVAPTARLTTGQTGGWQGIRLVVDDSIPATPGYEVHRAVWAAPGYLTGLRTGNVEVHTLQVRLAA